LRFRTPGIARSPIFVKPGLFAARGSRGPATMLSVLQLVCVASSVALMCSGLPDAWRMWRAKSSFGKAFPAFAMMLLDNLIGVWFARLVGDELGHALRVAGTALAALYVVVYLSVSRAKHEATPWVAVVASTPPLLWWAFR
jgi:hypothetical protein